MTFVDSRDSLQAPEKWRTPAFRRIPGHASSVCEAAAPRTSDAPATRA
ncbi:hypothetical protein [Streptomyces sp. NPDC001970]